MKSMEEMMAAAQKAAETIQNQMGDAQAKLDSIEVEGTAGGGLVKVRCTARGRMLGVAIARLQPAGHGLTLPNCASPGPDAEPLFPHVSW